MGDTSIRLSEEAKSQLDLHKRDDESYDDVILRLTSGDKWAGFGIVAGDPEESREGLQEIRQSMREGIEQDIEETGE